MPLTSERLEIDGVVKITPQRFADSRGYFVETYNKRVIADAGVTLDFIQDNEALSADVGTLRGLHFQVAPEPQTKLVRVITGAIFDAVVDLRDGSPTYGKWCGTTLTAAGGEQLFVPAGFAHSYCTLEPNTLVAYKVDGFYNKGAERGIRWDDPDIGVEWPIARDRIKVSEKDAALPFLRDAAAPFRFGD